MGLLSSPFLHQSASFNTVFLPRPMYSPTLHIYFSKYICSECHRSCGITAHHPANGFSFPQSGCNSPCIHEALSEYLKLNPHSPRHTEALEMTNPNVCFAIFSVLSTSRERNSMPYSRLSSSASPRTFSLCYEQSKKVLFPLSTAFYMRIC